MNNPRGKIESSKSKRVVFVPLFVIFMLFTVMPSGLHAESQECDGLETGERMKCKHGKFLDEQDKLITNLEINFGGIVPEEDFANLINAQKRAKKAKDRAKAKEFKMLTKKNPGPCNYAEADPEYQKGQYNEDGICDPGENCAVLPENDLDDNGVCKLKGKKKEVCLQVCGDISEDADVMEDDVDPEILSDWEETYDDVTKKMKLANETMENEGTTIRAMTTSLLTGFEPSDACKTSIDWLEYADILTMTILKQVAVGSRGIADIAERGCDQTGAGFNCASCCIIAETVASVAALTVETLDGIFSLVRWGVESASQSCLSSLSADLQGAKASLNIIEGSGAANGEQLGEVSSTISFLQEDVNEVKTSIDQLNQDVAGIMQQIIDLAAAMNAGFSNVNTILNTPQGQREDFPNNK